MLKKTPYDIIKSRHVTEKARVLENLQFNQSNPCIKKCEAPKYVFLVDKRASKQEIAVALEEIYAEKSINVVAVNTSNYKQKPRSVRGRRGLKAGFKKAIVTLKKGQAIDDKV